MRLCGLVLILLLTPALSYAFDENKYDPNDSEYLNQAKFMIAAAKAKYPECPPKAWWLPYGSTIVQKFNKRTYEVVYVLRAGVNFHFILRTTKTNFKTKGVIEDIVVCLQPRFSLKKILNDGLEEDVLVLYEQG